MVNKLYIKLGVIGLCIVAITLGIGITLGTRRKETAVINVAKSTSIDSDLPWCPEETRRALVVPKTESLLLPTNDDKDSGNTRKLGLTFPPRESPMPSTSMPTKDVTPFPSDTNPTKAPALKGSSSPSTSFTPSAASPACKTRSPTPINKCVPSTRRGLGTDATLRPTTCICPSTASPGERKLGQETTSTQSPSPTICSSMRPVLTESPVVPLPPVTGTLSPSSTVREPTYAPSPCDGADCPEVPNINETSVPSPSPNANVCPPCPSERTLTPTQSVVTNTNAPSKSAQPPSNSPTKLPTWSPSQHPTTSPSQSPTSSPTKNPTESPSQSPTSSPTKNPTAQPSPQPSAAPTKRPTKRPTKQPTSSPSARPTKRPTPVPTKTPRPTKRPTPAPSTPKPTVVPTLVFNQVETPTLLPTSVNSMLGSNEGTVTVSTETTGPPTLPDRQG